MKHIAKALASTGRNGDTELLHVTKPELAALNRLSQQAGLGSLPHNPATGLPEASLLGTILPIVGAVVGGAFTGGTGTEGGYAAGAAIGGALGGYAGSRVDHTNPYLGTILGGVGGYMGGSAMDKAALAENAAGAQAASTTTNAGIASTAGTQAATTPAATESGIAGLSSSTATPTAAPAATPEQFSSSINRVNPWTGEVAPQPLPEGGMAATGPGYNYTDNLPPVSSATTSSTPATPPSGVASWIGKHPMETYMLGSAAARMIAPQQNSQQQKHAVYMAGPSRNQRQYTGGPYNAAGEPNYFTGNSLYNYTQAPGTTVQRYADGGAVTPKYTMASTPNVVQFGAGNNAPMEAAPDLRAAPLPAQTISAGTDASGKPISYNLPSPTDPNWYATAAENSPTATGLRQQAAATAAAQAGDPMRYAAYTNWQTNNPGAQLTYEQWAAMNPQSTTSGGYRWPSGEGNIQIGPNGGITAYARGGLASLPPTMVRGAGDGMSDSVPAAITDGRKGKEEIRVADGEYIVPADVVAHLGNGSSDAGAKHLDKAMAKIRKARTGNPKQGKQIKPEKFI